MTEDDGKSALLPSSILRVKIVGCSKVNLYINSLLFHRYHNLDDEPSCRLFEFDLESIPLERNILKEHILKEIVGYHMKRPKPILTPVLTSFRKPTTDVKIVEDTGSTKTVVVGPKGMLEYN